MKKVIVLKKSLIAAKPNQKATAASLGLRKIGDKTVPMADDAVLAGKVKVLRHLVAEETVED